MRAKYLYKLRGQTHVDVPASRLGACVSVCVLLLCVSVTLPACVLVSFYMCVRTSFVFMCRTPSLWSSPWRVAECCTHQSRPPASFAVKGSSWSQPSLWNCFTTRMLMFFTRTRHNHTFHPGATLIQVSFYSFLSSHSLTSFAFDKQRAMLSCVKQ